MKYSKNYERSETMNIAVKELSVNDGIEELEMLKSFPFEENGFQRSASDEDLLNLDSFKKWLKRKEDNSKGIGLKEGWVPDTTYWVLLDNKPVGVIKVRQKLNEQLMHTGGNIGYGIAPQFRGKKIMKEALKLILPIINKKYNIKKALISVDYDNIPSQRVVLSVGGEVSYEEHEKFFYWVPTE